MVRIPTIFLLGLIAVACRGTAPGATVAIPPTQSTAVPTMVESATSDVVALTRRVEDALALASRGNWLEAWEYYTLSFMDSCPKETFAAQVASGMNLFRGMSEPPLYEPLEFGLMSVTVNGATALVNTQIFHEGEPLDYGAKAEFDSWVFIDGEWWHNIPPGPAGCVN